MRIEWLPTAVDGLQNQLDYIGRRNPDAAFSHSRRVETAAGHLARTDVPLDGHDQFFVDDPFGNRIELVQAVG